MTGKVYRSAQGKMVDLGTIQLQNESTRAVGNMGVNARGDRVNSENKPIDTRNQQVKRQYDKQVSPTREKPATSARAVRESAQADTPNVVQEPTVSAEAPSGLAAAIARAQNKDE
jgi:hypothetical protein